MKTHFLPASLAAMMALVAGTVSAQVTDTASSTSTVTTTTAAATTPAAASDSSIVADLIAASRREIAEADVAITQASSDQVKQFATRIRQDHSKAIEDLQSYLQKTHDGMSSGMAGDSAKQESPSLGAESYQGKTGKEFDKAWVETVAAQHRSAIEDLRTNLIPRIQNSSLKAKVQDLLTVMGNHLREADAIKAVM